MSRQNQLEAAAEAAQRRKTVRLGRSFAGSIAMRLDAHPGTGDIARVESEKRILGLARDVLGQTEPDACAVAFLTHAVETHTETYGFSKAIYDELFKLHERRIGKGQTPARSFAPAGAIDPSRFLIAEPKKAEKRPPSLDPRFSRSLKV